MADGYYTMKWPRDGLNIDFFAHEILNYRYHWHPNEYELNILLHGSQAFCRGTENVTLQEDDILLVEPGIGHASFGQEANTRAFVLHFSASAFKPYFPKGTWPHFADCHSTAETRDQLPYRLIRMCAARIYSAALGGQCHQLAARSGVEMLMSILCQYFAPEAVKAGTEEETQLELVGSLISYLEQHYAEKVTLEDLADYAQYNRTYVSTLFKNVVGVNFYEYLSRLRFQHALQEMAASDHSLTDIALNNGFADLKSFSKRFKETLGRTPAEYRSLLSPDRVIGEEALRSYVSPSDALVQQKMQQYQQML